MKGTSFPIPRWIETAGAELRKTADDAVGASRRLALSTVCENGFPSTGLDDWKFTDLAALARRQFDPVPAVPRGSAVLKELDRYRGSGNESGIFVNGCLLSSGAVPRAQGIEVYHFSQLAEFHNTPVIEMFRQAVECHASDRDHVFAALNAAFFRDALVVRIGKGVRLQEPVAVVFASTEAAGAAVFPRVFVYAQEESQCTIIEKHFCSAGCEFLSAGVADIIADQGAQVDYYRLQVEEALSSHFSYVKTVLERDARVRTLSLTTGGALVRNEIDVLLKGSGGAAELLGLTVLDSDQQVDNRTVIDHAETHCSSREIYKGIYAGRSRGIFDGSIIVRPGAQHTDAVQSSRSLLLSADAVSASKPQLKIWADDVKCTHGATVGQLDDDALFYLESRGVPKDEARRVLTGAFAAEVVDKVQDEHLRTVLGEIVHKKLRL